MEERTRHIVSVDSSDRDKALHPHANNYSILLPNPLRNVESVELLSAEIPNSGYGVSSSNNVFYICEYALGNDIDVLYHETGASGLDASQRIEIPAGDYQTHDFLPLIQDSLNNNEHLENEYSVTESRQQHKLTISAKGTASQGGVSKPFAVMFHGIRRVDKIQVGEATALHFKFRDVQTRTLSASNTAAIGKALSSLHPDIGTVSVEALGEASAEMFLVYHTATNLASYVTCVDTSLETEHNLEIENVVSGVATTASAHTLLGFGRETYVSEASPNEVGAQRISAPNIYNLQGPNYIFLTCDILDTIATAKRPQYVQSAMRRTATSNNVFAKIILDTSFGGIVFDSNARYISNKKVFTRPVQQLNDLAFRFETHEGHPFDFNGVDHSFTLALTTLGKTIVFTDDLEHRQRVEGFGGYPKNVGRSFNFGRLRDYSNE